MKGFIIEDSPKGRVIVVNGNLTIEHACPLKDVLLEALESSKMVNLDLHRVSSVDMACLQVLCAANKTYLKTEKHLSIKGELPDIFIKTLRDVSIDPSTCNSEFQGKCLWGSRS